MKNLSQIPVSRPAATKRSPNRKPRSADLNRVRGIEAVKEGIIVQATTGKTIKEITDLLKLSPSAIYNFRAKDPEFRAQFDEAIASAVASARGKLAGTLPLTVKVIENTETGKNKSPLRFDAAYKKAKGLGVLSGEGVQMEQGRGGQGEQGRILIVNIIGNPETRQAAITLARALENRAGGDGSETEPGLVEKV